MDSAILLISCPDRQGLVATVTQFIAQHNGNILDLAQHVDQDAGIFFMRVEWDLDGFALTRDAIHQAFARIADPLQMTWQVFFSSDVQRMAIFVTKESHCLYDILYHYQAGDWRVEIPLIISNNTLLSDLAARFGIPFHCLPVTKETKPEVEAQQIALLREAGVDVVVLARYMQILSPEFVRQYPNQIINIHHSFLPAFPGAGPYQRAYARGVKLIGATSHYVTADLDEGPIIDQDVKRVNHRDSAEDLIRKGKDTEKLVLSRAITYHLQHRVLVYQNKTVIFE